MVQKGAPRVFHEQPFRLPVHVHALLMVHFIGSRVDQPVEVVVAPVLPPESPRLRPPHHAEQVVRIGIVRVESPQSHGDVPLVHVVPVYLVLRTPHLKPQAQGIAQHRLHGLRGVADLGIGLADPEIDCGKPVAFRIARLGQEGAGAVRVVGLDFLDGRVRAAGKFGRQHRVGGHARLSQHDVAQGLAVDGLADRAAHPHVVEGRFAGLEEQVPGFREGVVRELVFQGRMVFNKREIGQQDPQVVDLAVFVRRGTRVSRGEDLDDFFEIPLVGPRIVGVEGQRGLPALLPFREGVARVGDQVPGFAPPDPVFLHLPPGYRSRPGERDDEGQVGTGFFRFDLQRVIVQGPDAHGRRVGYAALVVRTGALDFVVEEGVGTCHGRIEEPLVGVFEVVGRDPAAIAPSPVGTEFERPAQPVRRLCPRGRRRSDQLQVPVEHDQAFEQRERPLALVDVDTDIEGQRLDQGVAEHLLIQGRGVRRHLLSDGIHEGDGAGRHVRRHEAEDEPEEARRGGEAAAPRGRGRAALPSEPDRSCPFHHTVT